MAKIYRKTDRIKIKIDDITVSISPMTISQKTEIQSFMNDGLIGRNLKAMTHGMVLMLKYGLKDISGLEDQDNKPYRLQFENDMVTDECIEDLFNIELKDKLVNVCSALLNGIPKKIVDHTGKELEGVQIISDKDQEKSDPN